MKLWIVTRESPHGDVEFFPRLTMLEAAGLAHEFASDLSSECRVRLGSGSLPYPPAADAADMAHDHINEYDCPACGTVWESAWSCACDDECPVCEVASSPTNTVILDADGEASAARIAIDAPDRDYWPADDGKPEPVILIVIVAAMIATIWAASTILNLGG